jgi:hypothetical protein
MGGIGCDGCNPDLLPWLLLGVAYVAFAVGALLGWYVGIPLAKLVFRWIERLVGVE